MENDTQANTSATEPGVDGDTPSKISHIVKYQFNSETGRAMASKSREMQQARKEQKRLDDISGVNDESRIRREQLRLLGASKLLKDVDRDELPQVSIAVIMDLALRVLGGEWEFKDAEQATKVAKTWHDVLRLEMNQATSISAQADTVEDRLGRLEELRLEAKRRVESGLRAVAGDL